MILASCWGKEDCIQILIDHKADTSLTTKNGMDAAKWLVWYNKKQNKSLLVKRKRSPSFETESTVNKRLHKL